jgi:Predicted nucleotide-binding protein containing TIR-like domain
VAAVKGHTHSEEQEPAPATSSGKSAKRQYLKQTDVPEFSLDEALRIPTTINDQFGGDPTSPVDVAMALDMLPQGRHFKQLSGAAIAYGIAEGGAQAGQIGISELGRRIVAPTVEGDDVTARREAFLTPRVIREFLTKYNGSSLPTDERVARNVLESMGVPRNRTTAAFEMIVAEALRLGLIGRVRERQVVNLRPSHLRAVPDSEPPDRATGDEAEPLTAVPTLTAEETPVEEPNRREEPKDVPPDAALVSNRRVFITHGSNHKIVDRLKELLAYGEFEPVVAVEKESTAVPVPEKVLAEMRACGAGIIHVGTDKTIVDADGNEHHVPNPNVLIEIGAAMALYGSNYILLVEEGTQLPSNLQGLYEVRYKGTDLDADATMKLLRAFKEFKS